MNIPNRASRHHAMRASRCAGVSCVKSCAEADRTKPTPSTSVSRTGRTIVMHASVWSSPLTPSSFSSSPPILFSFVVLTPCPPLRFRRGGTKNHASCPLSRRERGSGGEDHHRGGQGERTHL